jgi:xanthosine utilization system XapX-like protein
MNANDPDTVALHWPLVSFVAAGVMGLLGLLVGYQRWIDFIGNIVRKALTDKFTEHEKFDQERHAHIQDLLGVLKDRIEKIENKLEEFNHLP